MKRQEALLKASAAFEHRAASSSSLPSFPNSSSLSVGATTGVSGDVRGDGGRGGGGGAESSDVDTETTATSQSSSLALQRGRRLSAAASAFKEGAAVNTVTTTTSATAASSTLNPMTAGVGGEREREKEKGEERGGGESFFSKVDDSERTGNYLKRSDGPLSHRLAAAAPDLIPEDAIGALRFQLQLTNGSSSQRPNGSGNNKPNNKNDDASSALSSLFSGSGGGGGGVGGLGGLAVEFLRVGGPADTPYGSEAVCRRCNGEEVLGSGLFLRCEACFDW